MKAGAIWGCAALLIFAWSSAATAETIPAGATLEVRLQQPISSYSTPKGTKITGVLISPVSDGGKVLLPLGTTVEGMVTDIRKVGIGLEHETAQIEIQLDRLLLADGKTLDLHCRLTEVENARESVDPKSGKIQGIRSTSTISHRASGVFGTLAFGDPIATIFTTAASASVLRFSEPEILLPAGTEVRAELTAPLELVGEPETIVPPIATSVSQRDGLAALVRSLPFRTYTNRTEIPSDLTNLIFVGSKEAIQQAFAAAGWVHVDTLTAETTYKTVRSITENQGYRSAPMSLLLLDGNIPDLAYAKTLNTFSKRHHLRIWLTSQTWEGKPVWTSSSTHDTGIGFSKKDKTFIHLVDTHIDNERAKVVNDMMFTGCVTGVELVTRPWVPKDAANGTGEELITDGKIAVMQLNDCRHPQEESQGASKEIVPVHGNVADRTTRQTVLTLKNNLLRDNVVVMGYSGIQYLRSRRKKEESAPVREMDVGGTKYTIEEGSSLKPAEIESKPLPAGKPVAKEPVPRALQWAPPSVELGLHGGWLGYFGGNGGAVGYFFQDNTNPNNVLLLVLANALDNGFSVGGSVTLDPQKYLSHEFSFDYSITTFDIGLGVVFTDESSPDAQSETAFSHTGLRTSQFAYNLLINLRPKTSRLRPFFAVGPSLQLMHLDDAPVKKAPGWYKLGLSNIGLISAAWDFGSTPPLEGGGIFQAGLRYGGGVRYRVTPRWMARVDFRETLTSQPDFWTKSQKDILAGIYVDNATLLVIGPHLDGPLRQDRVTGGSHSLSRNVLDLEHTTKDFLRQPVSCAGECILAVRG